MAENMTNTARTWVGVLGLFGIVVFAPVLEAKTDALDSVDAALAEHDYNRALSLLEPLAEQGNAEAESQLAQMYLLGLGVNKNLNKAIKLLRMAAAHGNEKAQYNLGGAYASGEGVPWNEGEAVSWFLKAAAQGDSLAQFNLGISYDKGMGVPQSDTEAL